ncbi:MAG TPA: InlB B-repeat-containing protein [Candidatus Merdivicinus faecavium]|nr:InlB B-repeat-containing protein [Candidatus Merdivicinus faecavium]
MKAKKVLGLALSAMMAISAVVPWTGLTATAADGDIPQASTANADEKNGGEFSWGIKDAVFYVYAEEGGSAILESGEDVYYSTKEGFDEAWEDLWVGDHEVWAYRNDTTVTAQPDEGYEFLRWEALNLFGGWYALDWDQTHTLTRDEANDELSVRAVFKESDEPETHTVTFKVQDGVEGVTLPSDSATVNDSETVTPPTPAYNEEEWTFEGWFYQDGTAFDSSAPITSDMTLVAKFTEKETEPPVEQDTINKVVIITGKNLTEALLNKSMVQITAVYDKSDPSNKCTVLFRKGNVSDTFSTSTTSKIPADLTTENYEDFYVQFTPKYMLNHVPVPGTEDNFVQDIYVAEEGEQNVLYIKLEIEGEEPEQNVYGVNFVSNPAEAANISTQELRVIEGNTIPAGLPSVEYDESKWELVNYTVDGEVIDLATYKVTSDVTVTVNFKAVETPVEPETKYPYVIEQYVDGKLAQSVDYSNNASTEVEVEIPERADATLSQIMFDDVDVTALYGEGDIAKVYFGTEDTGINYIRIYYVSETPVEPETKYPYIIEQYVNGELVQSVDYSNNTLTEVEVEIPEREGATLSEIWFDDVDVTALYDEGDIAKVYFGTEDTGINYIRIFYVTEDAPAQDMTLNMTYADIDSDKVLGHGAAVISSDTDLTAWINEQYTGDIITYDGVQYVYTGVYASTANDTTINATLYYREVEVAEEDREIQLTFVDADDQTKVLGHGAGVVPAGETSEAWIYNVYNGDVIEYAGAKYVYTGSNTIVENEDGITATLLYRKAEVVEKDREIQLTFVDIDSNKTLGHGAGVVPAGEASEAWIYNVYNGDVITFENEKYTYTGANTIVENETSITATLYYKKAEVVGEDKEIQLTFVDADDQTKVLGHGAGVVLAGQTVEEWLNEVYPIGDVIEYAGAKYAYTGANAIVEGEDSFTATLLYRKTEALEKDKEIQLIFVDADNQTKVLGRGAGVVLAGQSIEEWLDEVYPIGDVITYKNEEYVYTGSKSVVEGEDSITATLLYRKDTDPTDPDEPDEPDPDRPSSGGGYYPSRPDEEEIDDPTTPEASNPGDGSGSAGPGGAGDGAVPVEDPGEELGDGNVPLVEAPQTGRKIAGSIALLAGAAVVAVITLKKRKDK